ncbi:MAG: 50S ribosomal protein L23 [Candidatus Andersenbacteria bacterium]
MSLLSFTKKIARRGSQDSRRPTSKKVAKPTPGRAKADTLQRATSSGRLGLVPLVTEKSVAQQANSVVTFRVRPQATKGQVAVAIAERYGVVPVYLRTMQMHSKRRRRGASQGRTNAWKKVYATLPPGKTIDFSI